MRKALIAAIVASALFAVGAFAANLSVTSEQLSSGEQDVVSCATNANISGWDTTDGVDPLTGGATDWQAEGATVVLTESSSGSCSGATVDIAVGTNLAGTGEATDWTNGSCTFSSGTTYNCTFATAVDVNPVVEVSVLVNGNKVSVVP